MYHNFHIHLSTNGHLSCFHVLAIASSASVNMEALSIIIFLVCMPNSGISGLYGSPISRFLRNLHTVLHSGYTSLHSHQQWKRVPFSPHLVHHLLFVDIFMAATLTGMKWYIVVVLICISLTVGIISCVCYISTCILWRNVCLVLWPNFWSGCLFFWEWAAWVACIFWRWILCQLLHLLLLLFPPIMKAPFSHFYSFFYCEKPVPKV